MALVVEMHNFQNPQVRHGFAILLSTVLWECSLMS
jgi:hypothetical protein